MQDAAQRADLGTYRARSSAQSQPDGPDRNPYRCDALMLQPATACGPVLIHDRLSVGKPTAHGQHRRIRHDGPEPDTGLPPGPVLRGLALSVRGCGIRVRFHAQSAVHVF
jgi:hypothetical protein